MTEFPAHLPVRLERDTPAGVQAGCTLILGLIVSAIGAVPILMTIRHDEPGERGFFYVFGGVFLLVGVLLLYSGAVQMFARATPETIVELGDRTLRRGQTMKICLQQPGPASMKSLRANLVGEERWATQSSRYNSTTKQSERHTNWHTEHLGPFNIIDHGGAEILDRAPLIVPGRFAVPESLTPSHEERGDDRRSVTWWIEVWGKVHGRADFNHRFRVVVE